MALGSEGLFSGTAILVMVGIIALIWILIEVKRLRHKIFAIFIIIIIIMMYFGAYVSFAGTDVDLTTPDGLREASKIYLSWFGSIFQNLKTITSDAIHLNWKDGLNKTYS